MRLLPFAVASMLLSLTGCADGRCSVANCQAAIEGCRVEPQGVPNLSACYDANLRPPGYDGGSQLGLIYSDCAEACGLVGAGKDRLRQGLPGDLVGRLLLLREELRPQRGQLLLEVLMA